MNTRQDTIETLDHQYLLQHCSQHPSYGNNPDPLQLTKDKENVIYISHSHTHTHKHTHTHPHTMEFYSAIRSNDTLWFEGKWMQLKDKMLSEVSQIQKDKGCLFPLMWKIEPKDKHIHKNKHNQIQTYNLICRTRL
jgi:hypothetical protein